MPDRTEIIERLRELQERVAHRAAVSVYGRDQFIGDRDLLTEAADLLEAGESRVEYRLRNASSLPLPYRREPIGRPCAEAGLHLGKLRGVPVRIQKRTVTESPWVDVEAGEQP